MFMRLWASLLTADWLLKVSSSSICVFILRFFFNFFGYPIDEFWLDFILNRLLILVPCVEMSVLMMQRIV